MRIACFRLLPLLLLVAAAPVPDTVRDRIVAEAAAMTPATIAFDRTTRSVRKGGGTTTTVNMVERWDGKAWRLVSYNGKPPSAVERRDHEKLARAAPVPGYHRLGVLVAAATSSAADAQGRTVLQIPVLPPGTVRTDSGDISSHLKAEATLGRRGDQVWVERVRVTAREPFRMNMLIKVLTFEQVSEYLLDSEGKPRLATQTADSQGTMFGFAGGEKSQVTYVYR